ncbi:hypothetical protein [Pseudalkalibacillus decolorationis]|uniref:hypothetical protein n=1 Tax=Pseudalkalibacillus decolorationis TaxID=163879 RepID=UPI0021481C94|nr:hypothetical protein [Pseudalkalibacillus decolorationis]
MEKELYNLLYKTRFSGISMYEVRTKLNLTNKQIMNLVDALKEKGLHIKKIRFYSHQVERLQLILDIRAVEV